MLAKLACLVLVAGATAASLLTVRQQRLEAAHEIERALRRAEALERDLARTRLLLARRLVPETIATRVETLGELEPIPLERCVLPAPRTPAEDRRRVVD